MKVFKSILCCNKFMEIKGSTEVHGCGDISILFEKPKYEEGSKNE